MNENFMNIGRDPTTPLDLKSISMEQQYSQLTEEEKLMVYHKLVLKADHRICDIETFIKEEINSFVTKKEINLSPKYKLYFTIFKENLQNIIKRICFHWQCK